MDAKHLLRDIQGLDPSSWWPPAFGWWLLLVGAVLAAVLLAVSVHAWRYRHLKWRKEADERLRALRRDLPNRSAKAIASDLSELLRRIAMMRCGRGQCAGLQGEPWLAWLTEHDPQGFDWRDKGAALVRLPYAPDDLGMNTEQLRQLISATLAWVHSEPPPTRTTAANRWQRIQRRIGFRAQEASPHV